MAEAKEATVVLLSLWIVFPPFNNLTNVKENRYAYIADI